MVTTIDTAGRVVIPKPMRDRLGLHGGAAIDVELVGGHIEIHVNGSQVRVNELDDGPVLVSDAPGPPLTTNEVRRLVEEDRER